MGEPFPYVTIHPGQLSLAIPPSVGAVSISESHTAWRTSLVSMVWRWQCKLVSGWGLRKRKSAPSCKPFGSGSASHAHTVVWECCKGDHQSQWERANFDPQPTENPLTDRHQIWITWLRRGHLPPKKTELNPFRGLYFSPYTRNVHPQTFECLLHETLDGFWRSIRHTNNNNNNNNRICIA